MKCFLPILSKLIICCLNSLNNSNLFKFLKKKYATVHSIHLPIPLDRESLIKKFYIMEKFQNKYRIPSSRLKNWDYGWNGSYFITINTANRWHYFGEIIEGEMYLNDAGMIAEILWGEIPKHFPFALLGEFIIMPNHIHGILMIEKGTEAYNQASVSSKDAIYRVSVDESESLSDIDAINRVYTIGGITGNNNPMIQENISRILRWYKGRMTFELHKTNPGFGWQSRFHDHIIRNDGSYQKIIEYIQNNPRNWNDDEIQNIH